ncbi:hypothetical protein CXG81DRAFT_15285, partial [Caulochytrium protostelioides]
MGLVYRLAAAFLGLLLSVFFREVKTRGAYKIPKTGPVIFVAAPHSNQFVDPVVLFQHCNREIGFIAAAASMRKPLVGLLARLFNSIPVERPQDLTTAGRGTKPAPLDPLLVTLHGENTHWTTQIAPKDTLDIAGEGYRVAAVMDDTTLQLAQPLSLRVRTLLADPARAAQVAWKIRPYVNQETLFAEVTHRLSRGGAVGIFPEGGSHDRTAFLPLKPGFAIMALSAMASDPACRVAIVPTGLFYFHADRFRSRAVVEFGDPIAIPPALVAEYAKGGAARRAAVSSLVDQVHLVLKTLTVVAPDLDTLMVLQAARRLYTPINTRLSLATRCEITRRLMRGYIAHKGHHEVQTLEAAVKAYNSTLRYYGLRDHEVSQHGHWSRWRALRRFLVGTLRVVFSCVIVFPGYCIASPVLQLAVLIAKRKQKEALVASSVKIRARDVVATWKIMAGMVLTPVFYLIYTLITFIVTYGVLGLGWHRSVTVCLWEALLIPAVGTLALWYTDQAIDALRAWYPSLIAAVNPEVTAQIYRTRLHLKRRLEYVIELLGPSVFEDFEDMRLV